LRAYDDSINEFGVEVARCEATARNVRNKLPRGQVKGLLKEVRLYRRGRFLGFMRAESNADQGWKIYGELIFVIEAIKHFIADQQKGAE
jgi:hypothetical protein